MGVGGRWLVETLSCCRGWLSGLAGQGRAASRSPSSSRRLPPASDLLDSDEEKPRAEAVTEEDLQQELPVEAAVRRYGRSKDHRSGLPQVVFGLAVTRVGVPVRLWTFPGYPSEQLDAAHGQGRPVKHLLPWPSQPGQRRRVRTPCIAFGVARGQADRLERV